MRLRERTEVDVEHGCVRPFDENSLRAIDDMLIQIGDRVDGHRPEVFGKFSELFDDRFDVHLQVGKGHFVVVVEIS